MEAIKFEDLNLDAKILRAVTDMGFEAASPIQGQSIPLELEGLDIIGQAQTGTGKTAAFAIPVCEQIVWEENLPQALVLEPSRELAVQVSQEIFRIGRKKRLKVPAVFGGFPIDKRVLMKENPERSMIFCGMIHGEMEQKERLKNVDAFRRVGFRYLIAADVAARGIDFEDVSLVVNYNFPMGREAYVHRIGRTGRNGKNHNSERGGRAGTGRRGYRFGGPGNDRLAGGNRACH